jgi:hypothetical protein
MRCRVTHDHIGPIAADFIGVSEPHELPQRFPPIRLPSKRAVPPLPETIGGRLSAAH